MMDLCEKGSGSGSENGKKICSDCKTTKTPLWRGGPDGPKSLCNACGIRHRKKRRALMGLNKGVGGGNGNGIEKKRKEKERRNGVSSISSSLKLKLMGLKSEVLLKRLDFEKQKKLGEEEQAAVLLMALSCGAVYG